MQKLQPKYNSFLVLVICYLYILLFVYASFSKLLDFENFRVQLAQSPLLSAYAGLVAPAVISLELLIVLLLSFNNTRLAGLYASLFLMIAFTFYIYLILNYSDFVPCSCGGVIEQLGWKAHLVFNMAFVVMAVLAIVITEKEEGTRRSQVVLKTTLPSFLAAGAVVALFLSSEYIIKKENNFIRRVGQHPVRDKKIYDLGADSYYFAGMAGGQIYLGNVTDPLELTSIDTALTTKKSVRIKLDKVRLPFRFIQVQVKPPCFYLYDGTVPVIYRGLLGDSLARTVSFEDCYFSQLQVIDSVRFVFRAQSHGCWAPWTLNVTLG